MRSPLFRLPALAAALFIAVAAVEGRSVDAAVGDELNHLGRYLGVGFGDGYHRCRGRSLEAHGSGPIRRPESTLAGRWAHRPRPSLPQTFRPHPAHTPIVTVPPTPIPSPWSALSPWRSVGCD